MKNDERPAAQRGNRMWFSSNGSYGFDLDEVIAAIWEDDGDELHVWLRGPTASPFILTEDESTELVSALSGELWEGRTEGHPYRAPHNDAEHDSIFQKFEQLEALLVSASLSGSFKTIHDALDLARLLRAQVLK